MSADQVRWLLVVAVVLRGLGAGTITGLLMMIPARRRLGFLAYAQATRALYAGKGVRIYGVVTVVGVLLSIVVTIVAYRQNAPAALTSTTTISCVASGIGFVGTARNLPLMRKLWVTPDDEVPQAKSLLAIWERWHVVGAAAHVTAFIALAVAIPYV